MTTRPNFSLSQHVALCPPPLHVEKKPRKITFRRRIFRKSSHNRHNTVTHGPLDDIIDEIKGDIWESPPQVNFDASCLDWTNPLKASPTCIVTPLPVSRIPSDQPLTIRKNRNSRSTGSTDPMSSSRATSHGSGLVSRFSKSSSLSSPSSEDSGVVPGDPNSSEDSLYTDHTSLQTRIRNTWRHVFHRSQSSSTQHEPRIEHIRPLDDHTQESTLEATIKVLSEVKELTQETQEFGVAVEVKGTIHNPETFLDPAMDIAFIIDNRYLVTDQCLTNAIHTVCGALSLLKSGDRVALYLTNCLHESSTGTMPEIVRRLAPFEEMEEITGDIRNDILAQGIQARDPPMPMPKMANIMVAVNNSLQEMGAKQGRTQIILLSPADNDLHGVLGPSVHQINPACMPYHREQALHNKQCHQVCCKDAFIGNWSAYQYVLGCVKQIIQDSRCKKPLGDVNNVTLDIRTLPGCEILELEGSLQIPILRLGEVHHIFARVLVTRSLTRQVNMASPNPVFQSSLDVDNLRQNLQLLRSKDASEAHLLSVQVFYQNTLHPAAVWNYREAQVTALRQLGRLQAPQGWSNDVVMRRLFHIANRPETHDPRSVLGSFIEGCHHGDPMRQYAVNMYDELGRYDQTLAYEQYGRLHTPSSSGPVVLKDHRVGGL